MNEALISTKIVHHFLLSSIKDERNTSLSVRDKYVPYCLHEHPQAGVRVALPGSSLSLQVITIKPVLTSNIMLTSKYAKDHRHGK